MRLRLPVLALSALLGGNATAQEAAHPVKVTTDLGFVNTAGNTDITSLNLGERLVYRNADSVWSFSQFASAVYGRTSGQETANQLAAGVRLDRGLGSRLYLFSTLKWDKDRFAGISRRLEEVLGLSWRAIDSKRDVLVAEVGSAFTQKQATTGVDENSVAVRSAGTYRHSLTETAFVQQLLEVLPNVEDGQDVRINSESSLVAPISRNIAVKLAYAIKFDNQPEPSFKKTDRLFTSGIQIVF